MNATEAVVMELCQARRALAGLDRHIGGLAIWAQLLFERLSAGQRLLAAGNGGSAAHAQHLTSELVGRFCHERPPFSAIALAAESSAMTAIGNDYGFVEVFARQVEGHGRPGDVFLAISTSGASPNLLTAADRARATGLTTMALTGPGPNPLATQVDHWIGVDAASTAAVQDAHQVVVHAVCAAFDAVLEQQARDEGSRRWSASR
ncbi:MAG TPA: SIS domain-containing protein [Acidimicrobiales bacterium]|nr:SIS domain-containing protein [Acidimicrobiales bacterium]